MIILLSWLINNNELLSSKTNKKNLNDTLLIWIKGIVGNKSPFSLLSFILFGLTESFLTIYIILTF